MATCQYKYKIWFTQEVIGCDEQPRAGSKLCIFHDVSYLRKNYVQYEKEATKRFEEKMGESSSAKEELKCIGYYLPYLKINRTLSRPVNFFNAIFLDNVDFSGAQFLEKADFSRVIFKGYAIFYAAKFFDEANFGRALFRKEANFVGAKFSRRASFNRSKFFRKVNFYAATFFKYADFNAATFLDEASFNGIKFLAGAGFNVARISGRTYFNGTKFSKNVDFEGAKFSKVVFDYAEFKEEAGFEKTIFSGAARFNKVNFLAETDFSAAKFHYGAYFFHCKFLKEAFFSACLFNNTTFFNYLIFEQQNKILFDKSDLSAVSFSGTDITRIRLGDNITWGGEDGFTIIEEDWLRNKVKGENLPKYQDVSFELVESIYRNLRENYEFRLRYDDAGKFFIKEMELKRKYRETKSENRRKIRENDRFRKHFSLTGLYYHLSRYGESISRPASIGVMTVFLSTLFWVTQSNPTLEPHFDPRLAETAGTSTYVGFREFVNGTQWLKAFERSFADFLPLLPAGNFNVGIIDYVIKIVGGALTFGLLLIAFRRKFERKYTR